MPAELAASNQPQSSRYFLAFIATLLIAFFLSGTIGDDLSYAQRRGFGGGGYRGGGVGGGGFGGFRQAPIFRPPSPSYRPAAPVYRPPAVAPRVSMPKTMPKPALPPPSKGPAQSIPKVGGGGTKGAQPLRPSLSSSSTLSRSGQVRRSAGTQVIQAKGKSVRIPRGGISNLKFIAQGPDSGKPGCRQSSLGSWEGPRPIMVSFVIQTSGNREGFGPCSISPQIQQRVVAISRGDLRGARSIKDAFRRAHDNDTSSPKRNQGGSNQTGSNQRDHEAPVTHGDNLPRIGPAP